MLAPTGTIGFMMDCDTTGIEPDLALVKHKRLVGGGVIKIVNNTVPQALLQLGYSPEDVATIVDYIDANGTDRRRARIQARASRRLRLLARAAGRALDCLARPLEDDGRRAAVPFRRDQQDDQHARGVHGRRHHAGLHRIVEAGPEGRGHLSRQFQALSQPLFRRRQEGRQGRYGQRSSCRAAASSAVPTPPEQQELFARNAKRRKLPSERTSITHKFSVGGHEGYITVGMYEDGKPGEIFIKMAKEGSTLSGFMDGFALSVSIALQYGVPLKALVDKFINTRFEPSGYTGHPAIRYAKSVLDYIGRWLGGRFISADYLDHDTQTEAAAPVQLAAPVVAPGVATRPADSEPSARDRVSARRARRSAPSAACA